MSPLRQLARDDQDLTQILPLLHAAFASMEGRINPPSSLHSLTFDGLQEQADKAEVWAIGAPPCACMILTLRPDTLYLGKLAVAPDHRGQGHARALLSHAHDRARALGRGGITLETRIELTENQRFFSHLGFEKIAETSHPGFEAITGVTFRKT
jgi:ribosomal protein S18 acetylase RimI-like enzyme